MRHSSREQKACDRVGAVDVETGSRTTCSEKMSCRGFQGFCLQVWIINGCSDLTKNGSSNLNEFGIMSKPTRT